MAKYIAKRVALALVTLVIVSMLTFFLMFLVPGGPFLSEKSPSPAVLAAMEEKYGLDKPVIVQYKNYMLNLLQGELGPSIKQRGRTVAQIIGSRFPVSARIGGIALAIAVVVGVVLGSVAALNRGKWIDNVIIVIATCGIAVPSFVVCTILLYIFSLKLGWLPSSGMTTLGTDGGFADVARHMVMPVLVLATSMAGTNIRYIRSAVLEILQQDYLRTARAKGIGRFMVINKHALRNALVPIVTVIGMEIPMLFGGQVIIEQVFSWPGLGLMTMSAISNRDYPVIMAVCLLSAIVVLAANLLTDILYALVDPTIQLQ